MRKDIYRTNHYFTLLKIQNLRKKLWKHIEQAGIVQEKLKNGQNTIKFKVCGSVEEMNCEKVIAIMVDGIEDCKKEIDRLKPIYLEKLRLDNLTNKPEYQLTSQL